MDGIGIANKPGQRPGNDGLIVQGLFFVVAIELQKGGLMLSSRHLISESRHFAPFRHLPWIGLLALADQPT